MPKGHERSSSYFGPVSRINKLREPEGAIPRRNRLIATPEPTPDSAHPGDMVMTTRKQTRYPIGLAEEGGSHDIVKGRKASHHRKRHRT